MTDSERIQILLEKAGNIEEALKMILVNDVLTDAESLMQENSVPMSEVSALQKEYQDEIANLQKALKEKEKKLKTLQSQLETQKKTSETHKARIQTLQQSIESKERTLKTKEERIQSLQRSVEEKEKSIKNLQSQIKTLESKVEESKKQESKSVPKAWYEQSSTIKDGNTYYIKPACDSQRAIYCEEVGGYYGYPASLRNFTPTSSFHMTLLKQSDGSFMSQTNTSFYR